MFSFTIFTRLKKILCDNTYFGYSHVFLHYAMLRTHTHTHARAHARIHAHVHTRMHTRTYFPRLRNINLYCFPFRYLHDSRKNSAIIHVSCTTKWFCTMRCHTHTHTHTHTHKPTTHTHTHMRAREYRHTLIHPHPHAITHTHTNTKTRTRAHVHHTHGGTVTHIMTPSAIDAFSYCTW